MHPHIFSKNINNITKTTLPNKLLVLAKFCVKNFFCNCNIFIFLKFNEFVIALMCQRDIKSEENVQVLVQDCKVVARAKIPCHASSIDFEKWLRTIVHTFA